MAVKRSTKHHRAYHSEDVALGKMKVAPKAQRELKQQRVDYLLANFDLDDFGEPVISWRDGSYYIIDGQHRIAAMKEWLGNGWEAQTIKCRLYKGLTEVEEADMFDRLADVLAISVFDKFRIRVTAGREIETNVESIVREQKLVISRDKMPGAIRAVGTLVRIYARSDGDVLARTLRIIRDAFGDSGLDSQVLDGIGHLCQRYNGALKEDVAIASLSSMRGGVSGLLGKAETLHKATGNAKAQCVAAAAVDVINQGRRSGRLPSWWKSDDKTALQ